MSNTSFVSVECVVCNTYFSLPRELYESATHSDKVIFFCPYGHELHFSNETASKAKKQAEKKEKVEKTDNVVSLLDYKIKLKGDL